MPFKSLALPVLVSLTVCLGASAALRADTVRIAIINNSEKQWTLKAAIDPDIKLQVEAFNLSAPINSPIVYLTSRTGSEAKTLYFDLPKKRTYYMHLVGQKSATKIDFPFNLGGLNKNYKKLRASRDVPKNASASVNDVNILPEGYQTLISAPMLAITGADTVVTIRGNTVTINSDEYKTR